MKSKPTAERRAAFPHVPGRNDLWVLAVGGEGQKVGDPRHLLWMRRVGGGGGTKSEGVTEPRFSDRFGRKAGGSCLPTGHGVGTRAVMRNLEESFGKAAPPPTGPLFTPEPGQRVAGL